VLSVLLVYIVGFLRLLLSPQLQCLTYWQGWRESY